MVCSSACVSSGMASATRPDSVYAAPKAGAIKENQAPEPVGQAEEVVRQRLEDNLPTGRGERKGALAGGDGLVMRAHDIEVVGQKERDLSQSTRVVEGHREGLGLTQVRQDTPHVAERA